jgi:predicted nucleic acid-binding protein
LKSRRPTPSVYYWDASATLSALIDDGFSARARATLVRKEDAHLLSTLAVAEVIAVLGRLLREKRLDSEAFDEAETAIREGPWRKTSIQPDTARLVTLSRRHALRGADLWHLAATLTLATELPEVRLLTFDNRLARAATSEGLA